MGDRREELVRPLARSLAVHLNHLRTYRGVRYVSASPMILRAVEPAPVDAAPTGASASADGPTPESAAVDVPVAAVRAARPAASPTPARPPAATSTATTANSTAATSTAATSTAATSIAANATSTSEDEARAKLQAEAKQWTPARKLAYLRDKNLGACTRCPLSRTRNKIVFGVGDPDADLMFIGEAPGRDEDLQGEPFVGAAGQRLNTWLETLGLSREQVYIANVLKCRPPNNRDPAPPEVEKCAPFLQAQIRAIGPRVIVALGRYAGMFLLGGADRRLNAMRGRQWSYTEAQSGRVIPVFVTYHPSYVLRREREEPPGPGSAEQTVLSDLRQALSVIRAPRP
ncbi:MAG: uracil-DNA glycosylase [Nannocystaceae bacterium]